MKRTAMTVMVAAAATAWAGPQVATLRFPASDRVIAEETLAPPAVADTDAAPLLQAAIDRVAQRGGGTVFAVDDH